MKQHDPLGIHSTCEWLELENYTIRENGLVDVDGNVWIGKEKIMHELPISFGIVTGSFVVSDNMLDSLVGFPYWVGGSVSVFHNRLASLYGAPAYIGGFFICSHNKLTTLEFGPAYVGKYYECQGNKLTTFKGIPSEIHGHLFCERNQITSYKYCPQTIEGDFFSMQNAFKSTADFKDFPRKVLGKIYTLYDGSVEHFEFFFNLGYLPEKLVTLDEDVSLLKSTYRQWTIENIINDSTAIL